MIQNYFKIAWRNLMRNKVFTLINIAGLAVGIAACLLLFIIVRYELSYDTMQPDYDRINRIVTENKQPDDIGYSTGIPFPALEAARASFPQVTISPMFSYWDSQVNVLGSNAGTASSQKFVETIVFFTDAKWFDIFHYKWLAGSPASLDVPNTTVLTKKMAEKYFGSPQQAMGKYLKIDNREVTRVTGILDNLPSNSDFPLNIICSFATMKKQGEFYSYSPSWYNTSEMFQLYMLLPSNVDRDAINHQLLTNFSNTYYGNKGVKKRYSFLQPLSDMHFDNRFITYNYNVITKPTLWTLSLLGIFILVMACINFINLSTAAAVKRSKEVGIRKVLGGSRAALFWQMMLETGMIVTIALLLAVVVADVCLPYVKSIASPFAALHVFTKDNLFFTIIILFSVTLFAGLYPAFVLSGFSPVSALKNKITSASVGGISIRRGLVVLQFGISQVLIIGTLIVVSQMDFAHKADMGFNETAVLNMEASMDSAFHSRSKAFKQALLQQPGVQYVTFSSDAPASGDVWSMNFSYDHRPDENWAVVVKFADEDYLKAFNIPLAAGTLYTPSDTTKDVVVNQTLLAKLGIKKPEEAIGKQVQIGGRGTHWYTIAGVVKDFKTGSLKVQIPPLLLSTSLNDYTQLSVKMRSRNIVQTRKAIEKTWNKFYPDYAFYDSFLDDQINDFYKQEDRLSVLYKLFAGIAIFISCLGLYGLVSFLTVQKTKEVGIRKVLGATIFNIMYLFSKEFLALIGVAFLIAAPIAWYLMNNWLNGFAYRISMGAGIFIIAIVISIGIAVLTVGYKSFLAAIANPVKSLRTE